MLRAALLCNVFLLVPACLHAQEGPPVPNDPLPLSKTAAGDGKGGNPSVRMRDLLEWLSEPIETKDLLAPTLTLRECLGRIRELSARRGREIPILVDLEAFKDDTPDAYKEEADLYDVKVGLSQAPPRLPVAQVLWVALARIPTRNATFTLRPGAIQVTTVACAYPQQLLQRRVQATFESQTLAEVLAELFEQTGVPVIVDPRVAYRMRARVTATFTNGVTLEAALRVLTNMVDLELVVVDSALYVTTPANARVLLWQQYLRALQGFPAPGGRAEAAAAAAS